MDNNGGKFTSEPVPQCRGGGYLINFLRFIITPVFYELSKVVGTDAKYPNMNIISSSSPVFGIQTLVSYWI